MSSSTVFLESSPLTAEDVEADRRYREALARRSTSTPSTPISSRDNRPPNPPTWDMPRFRQNQEDASDPPSPNGSSGSGVSPQGSSPQTLPPLHTEPFRERVPPRHIKVVTNMIPCMDCGKRYAPDQILNILNGAMRRAPGRYTRKDWEDAKYEDRWASYLRSLTRLQLVKETMDAICAQCILNWISEVQSWPWYDVERRVWDRSHSRIKEVLSA